MQSHRFRNNPLLQHATAFALDAVDLAETMQAQRKYIIGNQFLKSATSILANSMEAQNGESIYDFLHKMKIAAKEADESQVWLYIIENAKGYPDSSHLNDRLIQIQKLLNSIIASTKKKIELLEKSKQKITGRPLAH